MGSLVPNTLAMFRLKALLGGLVVLLAVGVTLRTTCANIRREPDGFLYTRMMLVDTGLSEADAHREASRSFLTTPAAHDPDAPDFYGSHPPAWYEAQYPLFRARPLAPRLAALLYPRLGFRALKDVSAAGVGWPRWRSTSCCCSSRRRGGRLGAIAAAGTPLVRDAATLPMTDGAALAWWTIALAATAFYARRPTRTALGSRSSPPCSSTSPGPRSGCRWAPPAALWWRRTARATRPGAAAPCDARGTEPGGRGGAGLRRRRPRRRLRDAAAVVVRLADHAPRAVRGPRRRVLVRRLVRARAGHRARHPRRARVPLFALAVAVVGVLARRRDAIVPVLVGVACAAPLAIVANPYDFQRALELPLTPVVLTAVVAAVAAALPAARATAGRSG